MTSTAKLRAYNKAALAWLQGKLDEDDLALLVKTRWITKDEGERIKKMRRNDRKMIELAEANLLT